LSAHSRFNLADKEGGYTLAWHLFMHDFGDVRYVAKSSGSAKS